MTNNIVKQAVTWRPLKSAFTCSCDSEANRSIPTLQQITHDVAWIKVEYLIIFCGLTPSADIGLKSGVVNNKINGCYEVLIAHSNAIGSTKSAKSIIRVRMNWPSTNNVYVHICANILRTLWNPDCPAWNSSSSPQEGVRRPLRFDFRVTAGSSVWLYLAQPAHTQVEKIIIPFDSYYSFGYHSEHLTSFLTV